MNRALSSMLPNKFIVFTLLFPLIMLLACKRSTDVPNRDKDNVGTEIIGTGVVGTGHEQINEDLNVIPASEQRPGNPVAGKQALITEPIVSCGVPMQAINQLGAKADYTLAERDGSAATLPYNLNLITNSDGVELAASNCLSCHAAPLFGELFIGLGNEFLDFTTDASMAVEQIGALVSGQDEIAAWEKYADRVAAIAPYMQTRTAGVNPANNLTFALMAHRNPKTMAWSEQPILSLPTKNVPPVSVPPWWRMKKKHAMFWMGEGRGDHASIMMTAAIMCSDTIEEVARLDSIAPDIRAFIESIEPPVYPFAIDQSLAATGRKLFDSTCSGCHGTYGEATSYPNRIIDIAVVGTDAALINFAKQEGQAYVEWFNRSPFGTMAKAQPSQGYVAPPLDGIWATGPFLHNGSVPSIRAVLNSRIRPTLWHHRVVAELSSKDFNEKDVGWVYESVDSENDKTTLPVGQQWLYDTRQPGYANSGHLFGDGLTVEQRDAVLEYLKTL